MRAHLDATKTRLGPLEYTTHLFGASVVTGQYLVLGARGWDEGVEAALAETDDLDTELRLTAVTGTPEGVEIMLRLARDLLSPGREWTALQVPGRSAWIKYARSEYIGFDTSVKITNTDRHPAVGVDSYFLVSDPA